MADDFVTKTVADRPGIRVQVLVGDRPPGLSRKAIEDSVARLSTAPGPVAKFKASNVARLALRQDYPGAQLEMLAAGFEKHAAAIFLQFFDYDDARSVMDAAEDISKINGVSEETLMKKIKALAGVNEIPRIGPMPAGTPGGLEWVYCPNPPYDPDKRRGLCLQLKQGHRDFMTPMVMKSRIGAQKLPWSAQA